MDISFYKKALDSSFDGILIADKAGNIIYVNSQYEKITGLKKKDIIDKNLCILLEEGTINRAISLEVLKSRKPISAIHKYISGKSALSTAKPIFDSEKDIIGVVNNTRNIEELIRLRSEIKEHVAKQEKVNQEITHLKKLINKNKDFIFESKAMEDTANLASKVAKFDSTVMIYGESGTGKEVLSKYIHGLSERSNNIFIKVNCAAIPKDLFESELFGYEKGAFTGASNTGKIGFFELANGGTLFLDEIGELQLSVQSKLLRAIQEKEITRVGGKERIKLDIRVIAATNRNLEQEVKDGNFRQDLYFRLNVFPITIPPLRERREDIEVFIKFFIEKLNNKYKTNKIISKEAMEYLLKYDFPGNVRELENMVEYLFILSEKIIQVEVIPGKILSQIMISDYKSGKDNDKKEKLNYLMNLYEKTIIEDTITKYHTLEEASKILGIHYSTLSRKMNKYDLKFIQ
ncbi:MAG: sigma 54-interacting transcriptional regulator [Terrisporobacter sp.]|uniref:sigma-54 interaction domain-containing protein n=1 Tax=Terrisporobacter sp. TaxID=1965305 RepID=UPI002FCAFFC9